MATYLVTGAAGFIGARFVESCNHRRHTVISVDKKEHFSSRAEHKGVQFGQIVDRDELMGWLAREKPKLDAIVHLGARTDTMEMDVKLLDKLNFEYSKQLWSYAAERQIPFVYASSAATYGAGELGYKDEESLIPRLKPLNPYGESKRKFDLWVLEQEKAGVSPPAWSGFKFFNVYGFGERHKGKMASVILHGYEQILQNGSVKLFRSHKPGIKDGEQKRDFIFVDDLVNVLHFALAKPLRRGIYNLGSGEARSFLDLARAVFRAMKRMEKIEFVDTPIAIRDKYQYFTQADMKRLQAQGYREPFTPLEDGVQQYIARITNPGG